MLIYMVRMTNVEEERRKELVRIIDEERARKEEVRAREEEESTRKKEERARKKEVHAQEEEESTRRKEARVRKKAREAEESTRKKEMIHRPGPHDVLCGRERKVNAHTGNVNFQKEARKLRERYKSTSNSEKFIILVFLVDVVRERGGRFFKRDGLAMDRGGGWFEADGNDMRKKAMQAITRGDAQNLDER
jgi:hypothetical protein